LTQCKFLFGNFGVQGDSELQSGLDFIMQHGGNNGLQQFNSREVLDFLESATIEFKWSSW